MGYKAWVMMSHLNQEKAETILEMYPLVTCKDCKYLIDHYGFMDDGYCEKMREDYNVKFKPKKDWFCADGERRETK